MNKKTKFIIKAIIALALISFYDLVIFGEVRSPSDLIDRGVWGIIGLLIIFPITSFFSIKGMDPNTIYTKKWNRIFNRINNLIIVFIVVIFILGLIELQSINKVPFT